MGGVMVGDDADNKEGQRVPTSSGVRQGRRSGSSKVRPAAGGSGEGWLRLRWLQRDEVEATAAARGRRQQRQRHRCATTAGSRDGATVHRRGRRRSGRQQQSRGGRKRAATVRRGLWQRESSGVRPVAIVAGRRKMRLRVAVVRTATVDGRRQWPWPARDTAAADGRRQFFGGDGSGWWQRSRAAGGKGGGCGKEVVTVGCSGSDSKEAAAEKKGEEQRCRRQMREERKTAQRACDYCDRKGGKDEGSG
ncbi:hypothetical protein BHE74_00059013 [Ensete ventricosum]|nr:hypothetical protein BHE74_00059013 [Ensete ventricosum]